MSPTAAACSAAHGLITGGYVARSDLHDLTVFQAREILTRAGQRIKQLDAKGREGKVPHKEIERAKQQVGKAVKETVRQSRAGQVAQKDLRGQLDVNAYRFAKGAKRTPLFAAFGAHLADSLFKVLSSDASADKLREIEAAVDDIELGEDHLVIKRVMFELEGVSDRAVAWQKRIAPNKVRHLKIAEKGDQA